MNIGVDVVLKATLTIPVQGPHSPPINPLLIMAHPTNRKLHNEDGIELQLRSSSSEHNLKLLWVNLCHPLQLRLDGMDQQVRIKFNELVDGESLHIRCCREELVVGKGLLDWIQQGEFFQENHLFFRTQLVEQNGRVGSNRSTPSFLLLVSLHTS